MKGSEDKHSFVNECHHNKAAMEIAIVVKHGDNTEDDENDIADGVFYSQ